METIALWLLDKILPFVRLKPHLRMVVKQEGFYRDNILLAQRADGDYEATVQFGIRNDGRGTLEGGGYWHTYVKETNGATPFSVAGEKDHQRGTIDGPIYPKTFFDFGPIWKFHIKKEELPTILDVHYFFSTKSGFFPKTVAIDPKTGKVLHKDMGKIGYELPN